LTERIGSPYISVDWDKVAHVIECREPYPESIGTSGGTSGTDERSRSVAELLVMFFKQEIRENRLPKNLLPIESGIGAIPGSVLKGLAEEKFNNLEFFTPGITQEMIDLIDMGRVRIANAGGLRLSIKRLKTFCKDIERFKKKIILRPLEVINNPEMVHRFGVIAINGAVEADIYGHVNSSHIGGTSLVNGVGGSGVFAANSYLSIFTFFSAGKGGDISTIVPMAPHVDQTEHNIDVMVTEQGLADLRGLSPVERARVIIGQCAHPDYRPALFDYLERAIRDVGGHEPHLLEDAFSFHRRFTQTGSMKEGN
jgi:succinyl-CoA:acetate CoA-transferase